MEYITFKPIIEPTYNTDLVKSIISFNAYNLPNYVKATLINNRIVITVKRGNTNVYFLLTKPFDYPNNFDYFQISCTCKYSDMSTINLFVDTINTFIKSSILNLSFGYILEFMNKKKDIISENISIIYEGNTSNQTTAIINYDPTNTHGVSIDKQNLSIKDDQITDEEDEEEILLEKDLGQQNPNSLNSNENYYSYFTDSISINPNEYNFFRQKINFQRTLSKLNQIHFEIFFSQLLHIKRELINKINYSNIYEGDIKLEMKFIDSFYNIELIIPTGTFNRPTYKFDIQTLDFININITPFYPVIKKDPLNFLGEKVSSNSLFETITNYIHNTKSLIRPFQEYIEEENFDVEYSINLFNLIKFNKLSDLQDSNVTSKVINTNIRKLMNNYISTKKSRNTQGILIEIRYSSTKDKMENLMNLLKIHGWDHGMNCKEYVCNVITNLNIAKYCANKDYYDILVSIIIFNWNTFKETINLDSLIIQYTHYINITKKNIDSFDNLFKIYNSDLYK